MCNVRQIILILLLLSTNGELCFTGEIKFKLILNPSIFVIFFSAICFLSLYIGQVLFCRKKKICHIQKITIIPPPVVSIKHVVCVAIKLQRPKHATEIITDIAFHLNIN